MSYENIELSLLSQARKEKNKALGQVTILEMQRDQLLEALIELRAAIRAGRYEDPSHDRIYKALIGSEAAIAAAKGGAA
jgi:hypothetical protein